MKAHSCSFLALFALLLCTLPSSAYGSCKEEHEAMMNCTRDKAGLEPPDEEEIKSKAEACFTDNGCEVPTEPECVKEAVEEAFDTIEECVQEDFSDFEFPPFRVLYGHLLDPHHPNDNRQKALKKVVKKACGNNGKKTKKVIKCLKKLFPNKKKLKKQLDKMEKAREECKEEHPISDECLEEMPRLDGKICGCSNEAASGLRDAIVECVDNDNALAGLAFAYGQREFVARYCRDPPTDQDPPPDGEPPPGGPPPGGPPPGGPPPGGRPPPRRRG